MRSTGESLRAEVGNAIASLRGEVTAEFEGLERSHTHAVAGIKEGQAIALDGFKQSLNIGLTGVGLVLTLLSALSIWGITETSAIKDKVNADQLARIEVQGSLRALVDDVQAIRREVTQIREQRSSMQVVPTESGPPIAGVDPSMKSVYQSAEGMPSGTLSNTSSTRGHPGEVGSALTDPKAFGAPPSIQVRGLDGLRVDGGNFVNPRPSDSITKAPVQGGE